MRHYFRLRWTVTLLVLMLLCVSAQRGSGRVLAFIGNVLLDWEATVHLGRSGGVRERAAGDVGARTVRDLKTWETHNGTTTVDAYCYECCL